MPVLFPSKAETICRSPTACASPPRTTSQKLEKFSHDIREAVVNVSAEKSGEHRVEVTLQGDGFTLRGEEHTNDLYVSLDRVVDKLEQRLKKMKAKRSHLRNHADTLRVNVAPNNGALTAGDGVLPAQNDDDDDGLHARASSAPKPSP